MVYFKTTKRKKWLYPDFKGWFVINQLGHNTVYLCVKYDYSSLQPFQRYHWGPKI